jgi:5,10-methylenetetrahydrofolate reductase
MARVRMGALAVAFGIQHDLDLECLVHTTTRDRTLMALESELLGAHALGVLPLVTARHAEFLHHEVPGITIPDAARAAMHAAGDRGSEVGLEQAAELLDGMRALVSGTYIMPSFGRYEQSAELVRRLRATEPVLPGLSAAADA